MAMNNTNIVQISVFANDTTHEALLVARLDNLGKGASGAAVQKTGGDHPICGVGLTVPIY